MALRRKLGSVVLRSLSRRALLSSAATFALSVASKSDLLSAAESGPAKGRVNLGLCGVNYYLLNYPFLNVWKCADTIQVIAGGANYWSNIPPGIANSAWDGFLTDEGDLVSPLPANVSVMSRVFYAPAIDGLPEGYNRVGEQWVLKWEGAASSVSIPGTSISNRTSNRIVWVWRSNSSNMWVSFTGMDPRNPPHNIRLCEARHEARLDAGEIFNPEWMAKIREGAGIIRFMDWQNTNSNIASLRFSDIPKPNYCNYGADTTKPFIKGGMPLALMSALANRVQSHPWVCIPNVLGTRKLSKIASISNSNPPIVKSPGHKWKNGDRVIVYGSDWPQIERNTYTVIDADQKTGTFGLADVDSSSYSSYKSKWSFVTSPYDLGSVATEVAPFAAHFRDNVTAGLVTYFEFSNEIWNFIFNAPHWLAAQARAKFGRDDHNRMGGYLAAHCMKVIRDIYGNNARHRWRGVLATQTVNTFVTTAMIGGVKQYIEENTASLKIGDLFNDLAVTGYFGGPFIEKNRPTVFGWMDLSERRWRDGLESSKYAYFNRIVNEDCADGRHTGQPYSINKAAQFWLAQKAIADANGLQLIQYEGGSHNSPGFFGRLTEEERTRFMDFYRHCSHTPEDAKNHMANFENFVTVGGQFPSKFVEIGPVTRYGNFGGLRYLGDSNPVWDAVVTFNRRS